MIRTLALGIVLLAASPAPAQDGPDPNKQLASYERYLERKPYHDWAFGKLVEVAVATGTLNDRVEHWRARVEESPHSVAARVVLARLLGASDELDDALAVLAELGEPTAESHRLVGKLELRRGDGAAAAAAFARAVEGTDDEALLELLHGERARALLVDGDKEGAVAAYRDLVELRPESFHLHVEAAAQLADHGLVDDAAAVLEDARTLAADDPERRARVLSELAKVHERRGDTEAAFGIYDEALELCGRGHWMRRELTPRLIALTRRTGQLEDHAARLATEVEAGAGLETRELWVEALLAMADREGARAALEAGVAQYPRDLLLARRLLDVLEELEDHEARVVEYQRVLVEHPGELELYLGLGRAFADAGQLDAARREWQRSLEQRVDDPSLCDRIGRLFANLGQVDDAVGMFERAIALLPDDLRRYGDLAAYLRLERRPDEARAVLERAEEQAGDHGGQWLDVATLWTEVGETARARAAMERANELRPNEPMILSRLADLRIADGDTESAEALLRQVVEHADDANLRRSATDRLLRAVEKAGRLDEVTDAAHAAIEAGSEALAPRLIAIQGDLRRGRMDAARALMQTLLDEGRPVPEVHRDLARMLERAGQDEEAIAVHRRIAELRPQEHRRVLEDIARLYVSLSRVEEAIATHEERLRLSPDNPAVWLEVARAYDELYLPDEALRCARSAVRLAPEDGATRLALAKRLEGLGEWDEAEQHVLQVAKGNDPEDRADALDDLHRMLQQLGDVDRRIEDLRVRTRDNPYDVESSLVLSDLYVRELEYEPALEVIEGLLDYQPAQVQLLAERARLLEEMGRWHEARDARETLARLPDVDPIESAFDRARVALEMDELPRARQLLAGVRDRRKVAKLLAEYRFEEEARATLEQGLTGDRGDIELLRQLAHMLQEDGDDAGALQAYQRMQDLEGDSYELARKIGELQHALGDEEATRATGRRLFQLARNRSRSSADPRSPNSVRNVLWGLQSWFRSVDLEEDYTQLLLEEARLFPADLDLLANAGSRGAEDREKAEELLELAARAREAIGDDETREGMVWTQELTVYGHHDDLAEAALAAFDRRQEATDAAARAWLRAAQLLIRMERKDEAVTELEQGLGRHPDDLDLATQRVRTLMELDRNEEALAALDGLQRLAEEYEEPEPSAEQRALTEQTERRNLRRFRSQFPKHLSQSLSDDRLREIRALSETSGGGLYGTPSPRQVIQARFDLLRELEREDEAALVLTELVETATLADRVDLARKWIELERPESAEPLLQSFLTRFLELDADPVIQHGHGLESTAVTAGRELAKLREDAGDLLGAYELIRTWGNAGDARLLLGQHDLVDDAITLLRERVGDAGSPDQRRNARVRLAETLQDARRWDDALAVYERNLEEQPDDVEVLDNVALLHERAGRWEQAVEVYERAIQAKLDFNRRKVRGDDLPTRWLRPTRPEMPARDEDYTWQNLRRTRFNNYRYAGAFPYELQPTYASILKLLLDNGEVSRATEVLVDLATADPRNFQRLTYSLPDIIERYELGAGALPLLRLLTARDAARERTRWQYCQALVDAEKLTEARRELRALSSDGAVQSYYRSNARTLLETVEKDLGLLTNLTLADLERAVVEDPKSTDKRVDLAARLREEGRDEDALEHLREAVKLSPHRNDVGLEFEGLLASLGHFDALAQRWRSRLPKAEGDDRLLIGARLAEWALLDGDRDEALSLLDLTFDKDLRQNYSPAGLLLYHGDREGAIAALQRDLELLPEYRQDETRLALTQLEGAHDLDGALTEARKELADANAANRYYNGVANFLKVYQEVPDLDAVAMDRLAAAEVETGDLGQLEAAAIEIALGRVDDARLRLEAMRHDFEDGHFLVPTLVRLARSQADWDAAAALLQELLEGGDLGTKAASYVASTRYSERDLVRAELGLVLLEAGDPEGARAAWEGMLDLESGKAPLVRAQLAAEGNRFDLTLEWTSEYLDEAGNRDVDGLAWKLEACERLGLHAEAIELMNALLLVEEDEDARAGFRHRILTAHRRNGSLPAYLVELEERYAADPDDHDLARTIALLRGELGDGVGRRELLEDLVKIPALAARVLPELIEDARAAGDDERAIALQFQLLEQGDLDEWDRNNHRDQLARELERLERHDEAIAVLEGKHQKPDGREARFERAKYWLQVERTDRARAELEALFEEEASLGVANQLLSLHAKANDWPAWIRTFRTQYSTPKMRRAIQMFPHVPTQLAEEMRDELLAVEDGDFVGLLLKGSVEIRLGLDLVPTIEALRALEGDPPWLLYQLFTIHEKEGRHAEALAMAEVALEAMDRSRAAPGHEWSYRSQIQRLRQRRGELLLLAGDAEAAEAAWTDGVGMRFAMIETYGFRHGQLNRVAERRQDGLSRYWSNVEDWERALANYRGVRSSSYGGAELDEDRYRLRVRAGQTDAVFAELRRMLVRAASNVIDTGHTSHFAGFRRYRDSPRPAPVLLRLAAEVGQTREHAEFVLALANSRPARDAEGRRLRRLALEALEDWPRLAAHLEAELALDDNGEPRPWIDLADARREAGDLEGALEAYTVAESRLGALDNRNQFSAFHTNRVHQRLSRESTRFRFEGQRALTGRSSTHFGAGGEWGLDELVRRERAVLLRKLGRADEARAIERAEIDAQLVKVRQGYHVDDSLGQTYALRGLPAEGVRFCDELYAACAESVVDGREDNRLSRHTEITLKMRLDAGDREGAQPLIDETLARFEEQLAKAETDEARANVIAQRAVFWMKPVGDLDRARADLERAQALNPEFQGRPEVSRRLGDPARALEGLAKQYERTPWLRLTLPSDDAFTLGLAEAAVAPTDRTGTLLRYWIAKEPDHELADEAREALADLP